MTPLSDSRTSDSGLRVSDLDIQPSRGVHGILIENVTVRVLPPLTIRCRSRLWPALRWLARRVVVE